MNSKWYWLIRQKCRNLKFQIKKAAFRLNERKESSERLSSFSRIVIRTLLVQVAINLVLVAVLYLSIMRKYLRYRVVFSGANSEDSFLK